MARGNQTTLTLRLIDGVSKPGRAIVTALGGVNRAVGGMRGAALAPFNAGARSAQNFAHNLSAAQGASVAATGAVYALGRQLLETERNLNKTVAAGNLTQDQRAALYKNAIKLNYDYGGSVNDVIGAQNELLRSGLDFEKSSKALPDVMNLSQATGEDTISVARAIVTNLTALRLGMDQTARSADIFVQALDRTAGVDLIDFETSGKYFNPVAAATGQSAEEAMAYQVEMALRGLMGSSSGTGLRAAPAAILAPTEKARGAMEGLGIKPENFRGKRTGAAGADQIIGALSASGIDSDALEGLGPQISAILDSKLAESKKVQAIIGELGDLSGVATAEDRGQLVQTISRAMASGISEVNLIGFLKELKAKGAGFADYEAIFGRYHASKFLGFDPEAYDRELALMRTDARGGTDRKSKIMMAGLPGDVNEAEGAVQGFIASLSNAGVLSDFSKAAQTFAKAMESVSAQNPNILRLGFGLTALLAVLAPMGLIASGAAAALGLLVSPITLVAAAMAGLVAINLTPLTNGLKAFGWGFMYAIRPEIAERLRSTGSSMKEFFSSLRMGDWDLLKVGSSAGAGFARAINAIYDSVPKLRGIGDGIVEFGTGALARVMPQIEDGKRSLEGLFDTFLGSKVDAVIRLGTALQTFGSNVVEGLGPSVGGAIDMVASSFNTLTAGGETIVTLLESVRGGFVNFASGLLEGISPEAMATIGNGLSSLFETVRGPITMLGDGFRDITAYITGSTDSINSFATTAGSKVGEAISWIVNDLSNGKQNIINAWEGIKALFAEMGSYVPDFGPLVGAIGSAIGSIVGAIERIAGAVTSAKNAIAGLAGGGAGAAAGPKNPVSNPPGMIDVPVGGGQLPMRAGGGAVRRGPYLVGERGPEVVHMGGNGYVTPNHRLGAGGATGPVTIHVNGARDPAAVAREVMKHINRRVSRSSQLSIDGRTEQ